VISAWMTAAGLGLLCAVSPCPMAANVAAVSYLARAAGSPRRVLLQGVGYAAGRALSYLVIALVLQAGLASAPSVSHVLQKYVVLATGPLLILVAVVLLDLLPLRLPQFRPDAARIGGVAGSGFVGAVLLGGVFALAMCPPSAAIYFGGVLPLAVGQASVIPVMGVFGVATALPVVAIAIALALGFAGFGRIFGQISRFERVARIACGVCFLLAGLLLTLGVI
jgi:cytochrome c-type biogenesis protein